jgi:hypothetical protein
MPCPLQNEAGDFWLQAQVAFGLGLGSRLHSLGYKSQVLSPSQCAVCFEDFTSACDTLGGAFWKLTLQSLKFALNR